MRRDGGWNGGDRSRSRKEPYNEANVPPEEGTSSGGQSAKQRVVREPLQKPEGCKTIWVGWFGSKPLEQDLANFFKDCGAVSEVRCSDRHHRGYFAHVQFEDTNFVDEALKKAGETFMDTRIQMDFTYMDKVATIQKEQMEAVNFRRYKPKSVKPPNGHTLWIGDLSIEVTEQDMIDLFEPCGKIEMICLQVNQLRNGQFGHVKFIDTEAVDKAAELAGSRVKGIPMRLDYAEDKPMAAYRVGKERFAADSTKPPDCRTVWVGGIPTDVTEEQLRNIFSSCGEITQVRLERSRRTDSLYAHVEFLETGAVDEAIRMSGERINTSRIRVDYAENRSRGNEPSKPPAPMVKSAPLYPGGHPMDMSPPGYSLHGHPPPGWHPGIGPPPMGHHQAAWHPGMAIAQPPPPHHGHIDGPPPLPSPPAGWQVSPAPPPKRPGDEHEERSLPGERGTALDTPPGNFSGPWPPRYDERSASGPAPNGPMEPDGECRSHGSPPMGVHPGYPPTRPPLEYYRGPPGRNAHYWDYHGQHRPPHPGEHYGYRRDVPPGYYGGPPPGYYGHAPSEAPGPSGPPPDGYYNGPLPEYHHGHRRPSGKPLDQFEDGPPPGDLGPPPGEARQRSQSCGSYTYSSYSYSPERDPSPDPPPAQQG